MQLFLMSVMLRQESLAPTCEKGLLRHSMGKRAMFENCAVEHGTVSFYLYTYSVKFKYLPCVII